MDYQQVRLYDEIHHFRAKEGKKKAHSLKSMYGEVRDVLSHYIR